MQLTSRRRSFQNLSGFQLQYHHRDLQRKAPHVVNERMQQRWQPRDKKKIYQLIDFDIKSYYASIGDLITVKNNILQVHQNLQTRSHYWHFLALFSKICSQLPRASFENWKPNSQGVKWSFHFTDSRPSVIQSTYHFDTAKVWTAGGVGLNEFVGKP